MKICIVTEQLAGIGAFGEIGDAFFELATLYARNGVHVTILHCPPAPLGAAAMASAVEAMGANGILLSFLDYRLHAPGPPTAERRSFAVFRHLMGVDGAYDAIHFHDQKGLGYFAISAKHQGLAFGSSTLIIHLHGPIRWVHHATSALPTHSDHLKIDYMERKSIGRADAVVSPSQDLIDWLREHDFQFPTARPTHVIRNASSSLTDRVAARPGGSMNVASTHSEIDEIIFFSRLDEREGLTVFCDALDLLCERLAEDGIKVTFLGEFGEIGGRMSGIVLAERARKWRFPISVTAHLDRDHTLDYMASRPNGLVVVPSPEGSNPYSVIQAILLRMRLIASHHGSVRELIDEDLRPLVLCKVNGSDLARKIGDSLSNGVTYPVLSESAKDIEDKWLSFHERVEAGVPTPPPIPETALFEQPRVVLGITHYERPGKLFDAVASAIRQTYRNLQIVVLDDASQSRSALEALDRIEVLLTKVGGILIRKEKNGYLGAARNSIAAATDSDYLCFLDDDDIAFPDLIEKLVAASIRSGADIMNCANIFMPESRRHEAWPEPQDFGERVSYVPIGGPLALSPIENTLGASTALIKRTLFDRIGGYTELHGVGYEDWELYVRALQAGAQIEVCPLPLYLYEVDRPSMVNNTSSIRNSRRLIDAIDFTTDTDAWHDLIALRAGQTALERAANQLARKTSKNPHRTLLSAIANPALPMPGKLGELAAYASHIGSPIAEKAFLEALDSVQSRNAPQQQDRSREAERGIRPSQGTSDTSNDQILDTRIALAMGKNRLAVENFMGLVEKKDRLSVEEWRLAEAVSKILLDQTCIERIHSALSRFAIEENSRSSALFALFSIARQMSDTTVMQEIVHDSIESDERDYLERHSDVAAAVASGKIGNGLMHYQRWGFAESRHGFHLSGKIARSIDTKAGPWDLYRLLEKMVSDKRLPVGGQPNSGSIGKM